MEIIGHFVRFFFIFFFIGLYFVMFFSFIMLLVSGWCYIFRSSSEDSISDDEEPPMY